MHIDQGIHTLHYISCLRWSTPPSLRRVNMGAVKKYDYPKYVWSPAGGWWCNPPNWKRNTAVAGLVTVAICIPLWMLSNKLEKRYVPSYAERIASWKQ